MIRIRIQLPPARKGLYEQALTRLRGVEVADGPNADALISGEGVMDPCVPCLLDRPEHSRAVAELSTQLRAAVLATYPADGKTPEIRNERGLWAPNLTHP